MITDLAFDQDPRKLRRYRFISGRLPYRLAAERLLQSCGTVFVLTGFYIHQANAIETDGLSGSWVLYQALQKLGRKILLPVDAFTAPVLSSLFPKDACLPFPSGHGENVRLDANRLLERHDPGALISIERPGPDSSGFFRNARGHDISAFCARLDYLWVPSILKVGIGDGGNELGMGDLIHQVDDGRPICPVAADITLLGSTSDYAAWCLCAALEILTGVDLFPEEWEISEFLCGLPGLGVVDGMTGRPEVGIDGNNLETVMKKYRQIRDASERLRNVGPVIDRVFQNDRDRHPVCIANVSARIDTDEQLHLDGSVLLSRQRDVLRESVEHAGLKVASLPVVISDPEESDCPWLHIPGVTADLLDNPEGRTTTQISEYDHWVRRLWISGKWGLYQTPDLAMGWSEDSALLKNQSIPPDENPWRFIRRPVNGTSSGVSLSVSNLGEISARYDGIPYRWGGRNMDGMDCSGLIQRIFFVLGVLMPRHSRDQRRCGVRVLINAVLPGDLLFARSYDRRYHHVALVLPNGIHHACRSLACVVTEPIDRFKARYNIIAARRVSPFA